MHNDPADKGAAARKPAAEGPDVAKPVDGAPEAAKPGDGAPEAVNPAGKQADKPAAKSRRQKAASRGLLTGLLSAVAIVAAGGAVLATAAVAPPNPGTRPLEAALAAVPAGTTQGVCPGPARLLEGTADGTDPQFSPESSTAATSVDAVVVSTPGGTLPPSRFAGLDGKGGVDIAKGTAAPAPAAATVSAGVLAGRAVSGISVLNAQAVDNNRASAAALVRYSAGDGDLRGIAAANCQQPANDLWLVGANTSLGRTAVLTLTNTSSNPATVNLELFGAEGQIQAPGSRGLLVAPGTSRSIVLAGLAPGEKALGIHVRSAGGPVAAVIQQSVLRGLQPGGVDYIVPGAGQGIRQAMTGVDIQDPAAVASLTARQGFSDAGPVLYLTVPGSTDAVVEIKLFGRDGQKALPSGGVVTAKAGAVTEVPLAGVPAGQYTVSATSDVSFVAASRTTRGTDPGAPTDVSWSPSAPRLGSQHLVPVPSAGERRLVIGALEDRAAVSYTPVTADGRLHQAASADIAGGTTASIDLPREVAGSAVTAYVVSATGDAAYGALSLQDGTGISTVALTPGAEGQEQVPVRLGY
ncbi:DUF5719 family protein [Pseudarthrobacter sp. J75]|uniref:DUF5719 family protein n=1 Tax=unclassified Pseudarthrobacter TaxID=2647000 RepID=UPI002E81528B|nr:MULTISPECIES: DUF5719 family protein [unclassified Pseudarthrobacter]MEE2521635.1 DUF5719 family protein [Pseudarthrobacter sp. J47]MEE2527712.1 DUF5719 family protein [Pseudarthrobacter sp. J75]